MTTQQGRYQIVTLGCRTNQYESQAYRDQLEMMGYSKAAAEESADICIVNSCTVTESADSRSRHQIRHLIRANPGARVVVTGCMAESAPEEIKAIEGVSLVVPNPEKESLVEQLFPESEVPEFSIRRFDAHTRAFVKVQDGCNSFCSYCIIPYVRGRSRSRKVPDILREVNDLVASGYKEVVITGINVGDFDDGSLADLIRAVDKVDGLERIRVSSIDPDEVDADLMDAILGGEKTCPSMHIVLQAGSNVTLKRMRRKYTRQIFFNTVEELTRQNPDFTVTTDIIVGFPGETEDDFLETLDVMERVQFAKVHMFPYSRRPKTRADRYKDHLPQAVIMERKARLLQAAERSAYQLRERFVGRTLSVLTEARDKERPHLISGHTGNFLPVLIDEPDLKPNQLIDVVLTDNAPDALNAQLRTAVEGVA